MEPRIEADFSGLGKSVDNDVDSEERVLKTVARGGCVIDSDSLHIDAQLEEQLARIFDALDE